MEFSTCPSHILGLNCWKSTGRLHLLQLTKFNKSLCSFCTPVDDYSEFSSHLQPHRAQQQLNFCTFSILSSLWRGAWMPQSCQDIIIRKKKKKVRNRSSALGRWFRSFLHLLFKLTKRVQMRHLMTEYQLSLSHAAPTLCKNLGFCLPVAEHEPQTLSLCLGRER